MKLPLPAHHPHARFIATDRVGALLHGDAHAFHDWRQVVRHIPQTAITGPALSGRCHSSRNHWRFPSTGSN